MTAKTFKIHLSDDVALDARTLVDTRALIAGSSGSGKSYCMRVIAEQAAPKLQTIVLDPEGEYTTLRCIAAVDSSQWQITDEGLEQLGDYEPLSLGGDALIARWGPEIGRDGGKRRIFDALAEAGRNGLTRTELAEAAGLEAKSGTYGDYLSRLRRKGLVDGGRGQIKLVEVFFS